MVELGSRFEDLNLSAEDTRLLKAIEQEHGQEIISFPRLVSILGKLARVTTALDSAPPPLSLEDDLGPRIKELESKLVEKAEECDRLRREVLVLREQGLPAVSLDVTVRVVSCTSMDYFQEYCRSKAIGNGVPEFGSNPHCRASNF